MTASPTVTVRNPRIVMKSAVKPAITTLAQQIAAGLRLGDIYVDTHTQGAGTVIPNLLTNGGTNGAPLWVVFTVT